MKIQTKRVYDEPSRKDGKRFLVDRVWPRGIKKDDLDVDDWLKEVAPSTELRRWFNHDPKKWDRFCRKYRAELDANADALRPLYEALKEGPITLLYAARDEEHNQAVVLRRYLSENS